MEGLVRRFDSRLKIALGLLTAVLAWKAGPAGVAVYALALSILLAAARLGPVVRQSLQGFALFLGLWAGLKFLAGALEGLPLERNLAQAGLLAVRLYVLLGIGLILSASTSPRALGLAASWYLRPLGRWSWQPALALALMIHYLPHIWETFAQVRQAISLRCQGLPRSRKLALLTQASLRALAQKTWDQTMALSARGLDRPEAWQVRISWKSKEMAAGLALAVALVAVAML